MQIETNRIVLEEEDLQEIFGLFSSPSKEEYIQTYSEENDFFYKKILLEEEYSLTQEKREFAYDAWRAVIGFLKSKNCKILCNEEILSCDFAVDNLP